MTNPFYGSSLFQARKTGHDHVHSHSHLHSRWSHSDIHVHSHEEFHNSRADTADLDSRDSTITEVVQTVSVVQVIDGSGATIEVETKTGNSQTDLIDSATGSTVSILNLAAKDAATTSSDVGASTTSTASAVLTSSADPVSATPEPTISSTDSTASSAPETTTSVPAELSLTHISGSSFSTLSSTSNSTTSSLTSYISSSSSIPSSISTTPSSLNSTSSYTASYSGSSSFSSDLFSATTFASSTISSTSGASSSYSSSGATFGDSSSTSWPSASDSASATYGSGGGDGSGASTASAGTSASSSSSTSTSSGSSSGGSSVQTGTVVGGIFGGIAGIALLVGLAFIILRMKKSGWCQLKLSGEDDGPTSAPRAIEPAPTPAGDGGNDASGTMQRPGPPSTVAASLAALAGRRTSRERAGSGSEMAERGFVRVSGRKLPPVLQYGGDGYTDPRGNRNSQASENSVSVYRNSMAVFDQPNHRPLALGSPMRPESGILTVHSGPQRTPVQSQTPSGIDSPTLPRSSTFPSTEALGRTLDSDGFSRDDIGRTLAAQDHSRDGAASHGSRGSGRFTEHVA